MLLAEGLALRADLQKRLEALSSRIAENARVPGDENPDEDPNALLETAAAVVRDLTVLVQRINRTNADTAADAEAGRTISDMVVDRDHARRMTSLYRAAAKAGTRGTGRGLWTRDAEQVTRAVVDVRELQAEADEWAVRHREIDVRLQQLNWSTELGE